MNIRDDEVEHYKTMRACQTHGNLRSPHSYTKEEDVTGCNLAEAGCERIIDCIKKSLASPQTPTKQDIEKGNEESAREIYFCTV